MNGLVDHGAALKPLGGAVIHEMGDDVVESRSQDESDNGDGQHEHSETDEGVAGGVTPDGVAKSEEPEEDHEDGEGTDQGGNVGQCRMIGKDVDHSQQRTFGVRGQQDGAGADEEDDEHQGGPKRHKEAGDAIKRRCGHGWHPLTTVDDHQMFTEIWGKENPGVKQQGRIFQGGRGRLRRCELGHRVVH